MWVGDFRFLALFGMTRGVYPALWIDESPMNLYEILGLQRKGVNALSFSSRKRADQVRNNGKKCENPFSKFDAAKCCVFTFRW